MAVAAASVAAVDLVAVVELVVGVELVAVVGLVAEIEGEGREGREALMQKISFSSKSSTSMVMVS
jgi:hypothetical protein